MSMQRVSSLVSKSIANYLVNQQTWGGILYNVKAYGATGDGNTDDTAAINTVIAMVNEAGGGRVYVPPGTYMIDVSEGVVMLSNISFEMDDEATLQALPSDLPTSQVIEVRDVDNVRIIGGNIIGERDTHIGSTGERGMGIYVKGASNVYIEGIHISECWGDGIYVGTGFVAYSENIKIVDVTVDHCRRNGMSIISGKNVDVIRPECINIIGTSPQSGIDIEPNDTNAVLENIRIIDPVTKDNINQGIIIGLGNFANSSKNICITIENHKDYGSVNGFAMGGCAGGFSGKISLINPYYESSDLQGIQIRDYDINGATVEIVSPTIVNCNTTNNGSDQYGSAIVVYKEPTDTKSTTIGNVTVKNPTVLDSRLTPLSRYGVYARDLTGATTSSIYVQDPIKLPASHFALYGGAVVTDNLGVSTLRSTSDVTIRSQNYHRVFSNSAATALRVYTLNDSIFQNWPDLTFVDENASFRMRIKPESVCNILPLSTTAGKYIQSSSQGCRITIRKLGTNSFYISEMIGTWTVEP